MKTLKQETIRSGFLSRDERKLYVEKIISQLESKKRELTPEDNKNLSLIKELRYIENKLIEKEDHYTKAIEQNKAIIYYHQKLNDNLIRLNKISTTEVYEEVFRFMDELIIKYL